MISDWPVAERPVSSGKELLQPTATHLTYSEKDFSFHPWWLFVNVNLNSCNIRLLKQYACSYLKSTPLTLSFFFSETWTAAKSLSQLPELPAWFPPEEVSFSRYCTLTCMACMLSGGCVHGSACHVFPIFSLSLILLYWQLLTTNNYF